MRYRNQLKQFSHSSRCFKKLPCISELYKPASEDSGKNILFIRARDFQSQNDTPPSSDAGMDEGIPNGGSEIASAKKNRENKNTGCMEGNKGDHRVSCRKIFGQCAS